MTNAHSLHTIAHFINAVNEKPERAYRGNMEEWEANHIPLFSDIMLYKINDCIVFMHSVIKCQDFNTGTFQRFLAITGDTYPLKEQLKARGYEWDNALKAWLRVDSGETSGMYNTADVTFNYKILPVLKHVNTYNELCRLTSYDAVEHFRTLNLLLYGDGMINRLEYDHNLLSLVNVEIPPLEVVELLREAILRSELLNQVMTTSEITEVYRFAESTVRQAINRGQLPARKSGSTWLVLKADVEAKWGQPQPRMELDEVDDEEEQENE